MPRAKTKPRAHLPAKAPKKTGRRGIGPKEEETSKAAPEEVIKPPKEPKQKRLPTMEDPEIQELEAAAESYDEVKSQRVKLTAKEVELKQELLTIMKANKKTVYHHDGVEVKVVVEKENVKVKVKKEE